MSQADRLKSVLDAIDAANASDPTTESVGGSQKPAALLYGQRMTEVLGEFCPEASDFLQIAVRGQHIERWTRPRTDYPEGRTGYLEWRRDASRFHADRVSALMEQAGYDSLARERVSSLIRKQAIKQDAEAQTLEDVACLVFMRWYVSAFAATKSPEDLFRIVEKSARKMSSKGRQAALNLAIPAELVPAVSGVGKT